MNLENFVMTSEPRCVPPFPQFPNDADVQNSTIAIAVVFMQKFLTGQKVCKEWLQLLGLVCMLIAAKVNEARGRSITMVCSLIYSLLLLLLLLVP